MKIKQNKNGGLQRSIILLITIILFLGLHISQSLNVLKQEILDMNAINTSNNNLTTQYDNLHLSPNLSNTDICSYNQKTCINGNPEDFSYDIDTNSISRSCIREDGEKINCG